MEARGIHSTTNATIALCAAKTKSQPPFSISAYLSTRIPVPRPQEHMLTCFAISRRENYCRLVYLKITLTERHL